MCGAGLAIGLPGAARAVALDGQLAQAAERFAVVHAGGLPELGGRADAGEARQRIAFVDQHLTVIAEVHSAPNIPG